MGPEPKKLLAEKLCSKAQQSLTPMGSSCRAWSYPRPLGLPPSHALGLSQDLVASDHGESQTLCSQLEPGIKFAAQACLWFLH